MTHRIFVTRQIPDIAITMLRQKGYTVDVYPEDAIISKEELISYLQKETYDAVISLLTSKIDADIFDAAPSVKIYSNYASGFDNIDLAEATKRGIVIANSPADLTSGSVAEHTMAFIFALAKRLVEADTYTRAGKYKGWSPMNMIGMDLHGKTLGLIGTGRIGDTVATMGKVLGMNIIYTDLRTNAHIEQVCGATYYKEIDDVVKQADFISLHVPLMDSTKHLINEARLNMMKPTAFVINTARGGIIDEVALEKAIAEKKIAGAGLDVFEHEPKISEGLRKYPNVIMTPHTASASSETRNQMAEYCAQNIVEFLEGKVPTYIVKA